MKSRKQRHPARSGGSKKKVPSDVSPATSLPPLVEGPLRCFLRVTVSRVLWTVHKPPSSTFIRLRWWGESSNGTHFFPRDGSQLSQKTLKTTARFPIRCGPKQFTSYLTDMSCLVLEVLTKPDHLPIARAQVAGISRLTLSHPIGGFYTLISPTSEKLGELQVSLNLEPLTEAYDSSSSGPVTDISAEGHQVTALTVPSRPRSLSAGSGKESVGSGGNTPRGRDHLYFQNAQKDGGKEESLENQMPTTNGSQNSHIPVQDPHGQTSNDILSVILERGNKLKNAMVVSALMDSAPALKDTPLPLPKDNILPHSKPFPSSSGILLQNILHADSTLKHSDDVTVASDCNLDMDNRAVDLLLGSLNTSPLPVWDGDDSLPDSLSGHSSVCEDSELNDPQYDQSLLENLFYKTPTSDIRADDTEPEGRGAASLSKSQTQSESKISGGPASEPERSPESAGLPPGVSAELLNFLSSIRLARVTIESLSVAAAAKSTTPRKTSGKPPRPLTSRKCTYFIEYTFPVASTSGRSKGGAGEVTRVVSNKVSGGVVKFQQNSVFPVHFSTAAVRKCWETDLVFKVYSRKSDQKKPVPIGQAVHPLSSLLQSKPLSQCVILPVQNIAGNSETQDIGPLKVSLELIGGSNSKPTQRDASPSQHAPGPQRETSPRSQHVVESSAEGPRPNIWSPQKPSKAPSPHPGLFTSPHPPRQQEEENPEVLLHTLLMVPDGRNFSCGPTGAPNVYLNCKLWCEETARSAVSWGQANPSFNFVQVTPVTLTSKLLERMKNNVMVIEVWQKTGSSGQDRLLGIVKLPLHQFYLSFRDPKISRLLLQAQFPVLGVDCYMPLIDVFSGSCRGQLRVVLAMGRSEQILALQRTRDEEHDHSPYLVRPVHLLDHQPCSPTQVNAPQDGAMREHVFVMRVERINGLTPLQSTVWGEADCYIQYSFPCQEDPEENLDQDLIESSVNLKPFRTTTTLCVPDPEFGHSETHVLLVPEGIPVQRLLLSCLSTRGLSSGGGVQFEVWCRYYYPNVRDQLVAKGVLPLSRLCAMVTMQRQHPDEAQMFSLPLIPRTDGLAGRQPQPSGLLDVCIRYKHRPVRRQATRGVAARVVTLVVEVHRASGLQAAARVLSEQDEGFSYFAGVGVNAYVTVQLSFLPESERRCTRVAARTFSPEFEHHMEVCCDLLTRRSSGETCSLAEQLEDASALFTVWNKDSRKAVHTQKQKDVVLGSVKIPLADLIHKRTGISGWFGVYVPQETGSSRGQHVLVGGLELSISFAHHSERERVVKAARGVSWETQNKTLDDEDAWTDATRQISLTLSMPRAWIPVHCLLLPGLNQLERSTYCYFRYKFYEQEAFCSPVRRPSLEEEEGEGGPASVSFQGSRTVELRSSRPLMWYLREEKLEVQVWVAFTKDKTPRPRDTDRLVGSAFIDLTTLTKTSQKKQTISGVYPLFRRSAADLQGAALRVHITMTTGLVHGDVEAVPAGLDVQEDSDNEGEAADRVPSPTTPKKHKNKSSPDVTALQHTDSDDSFPVTVVVDQAMHLNLKGCPLSDRSEVSLSCCVSYVTADSAESVFTEVVSSTDCPVWSHQLECRLSNQLLVDPQQSLVFKVWHKGEAERVIGFASVDLSPLVCGLQSVCGWYNITDFSGQCHGQLKVSITPLKALHDLRGRRKTINQEPARSSLALPHNYNTTATCGSFPSHVSRHPEQKTQSLDHTDRLFSQRSSESERHFEHMDNVRLYHQSLHEQTDLNPSSSLLFSTLRKKLSELDDVQRYFSRKLSTPTFPAVSDQDCRGQQEDTETDSSQLLLKSNHLVGQVNNIINGLRGHHLETIVSDPQSSSTTSPVGENSHHTVPETSSSPHRPSRSNQDTMSLSSPPRPSQSHQNVTSLSSPHRPSWSHQDTTCLSRPSRSPEDTTSLSSPHRPSWCHQDTTCLSRPSRSPEDITFVSSPPRPSGSHQDPVSPLGSSEHRVSPMMSPKTPERHADPESEEDADGQNHKAAVSEDEDEEGTDEDGPGRTWDDEADDEEDDEDYEEVVLKPRSLNEVTSLTDRTSPWTSVLSDAGSLDQDEDEDEDDGMKTGAGRGSSGDGEEEDDRIKTGGGSDSSHESSGDVSDAERDGERTKSPEDEASQSTPHNTHDASCSTEITIQPSVRMDVPNFFLPSHQLEASLRAIRLAPSFSQTTSHPGPSSAFPRNPRRLPDMSPTSRKKETQRIARIFSSHCDDNH